MSSQYLGIEILLTGAILVVAGIILKLLSKKQKHMEPKLSLSSILASIGIAAIVMYVLIWIDNYPRSNVNMTESIIKEYKTTHKINCL